MTRHLYEGTITIRGHVDHEDGDDWLVPYVWEFLNAAAGQLSDRVVTAITEGPKQQIVVIKVDEVKARRGARRPEAVADAELRRRREQDDIAKHAEQRSVENDERN